jgi:5-methyltetrahydrofolate--homocysteine methyltransferase
MPRVEELYNAVLAGQRKVVNELVPKLLAEGHEPLSLLNESMIPAMQEVGERFSRGEAFIPEMLIAARAMQAGLAHIEPMLVGKGHEPIARVCIGAVKGDLHDIGKNLVAIMLRSAGFEVIDLGTDVDTEKFRAAVDQHKAKVVLLSALLSTTMTYMKDVVEAFRDRPEVRIIVGGAPVTQEFAASIGAHGYGKDASDAVRVTRELVMAG